MKIGMMTRWNVPCGVAAHAEPLGRAWVEMGHQLRVFAPIEWNTLQTQEDEPYVTRCYRLNSGWRDWEEFFLNPQPVLEEDYDVFVVQNLELMPMPELFQIYPKIRERAKTVLIIHEGKAPTDPQFYNFEWDAVVCFDERYTGYLSKIYPREKLFIIPYVCHPDEHGDKFEARSKLGLPLDKKIIFSYGIGVDRNAYLVPTVARLAGKYPILFLVLTHIEEHFPIFEALAQKYKFVELRKGIASTKRLYTYLHASDAAIFHKPPAQAIVVSSTVFECLGAGCPILAYDSNFVETLSDEILKYKDFGELEQRLVDVFEERENVKECLQSAEAYVMKNSSYTLGKRFIALFESLGAAAIKLKVVVQEPQLATAVVTPEAVSFAKEAEVTPPVRDLGQPSQVTSVGITEEESLAEDTRIPSAYESLTGGTLP